MTVPVGSETEPNDLAAACFTALAEAFFAPDDASVPFTLRDKKDTQDDPFDELVREVLNQRLPDGIKVLSSGKKLVSPDLVVARPEEAALLIDGGVELDDRRVIAIEVKKVNADAAGKAARASGMDYNSTPPCDRVRIYSKNDKPLAVPAYYLFAVHASSGESHIVQTMALVTGKALSQDRELYDRITGTREKSIGLGTFGDGLDRQRPMLVFANPLGWPWLTNNATLIHDRDDLDTEQVLVRSRQMTRTTSGGSEQTFWCYRKVGAQASEELPAFDPFPTPAKRSTTTTPRGRFKIEL